MNMLEATPGVLAVRRLTPDDMGHLLKPWLGEAGLMDELPLPTLLDITLDSDHPLDLAALQIHLDSEVKGVIIDNHGTWFGRLVAAARMVNSLALIVFVLVEIAAAAIVVFVTRTGLEVHHEVVDLMHIIGASDGYIARQFQSHALVLGLKGGTVGLALAAAALLALQFAAGDPGSSLLPDLRLSASQWVAVAAVPLVTAGIAWTAARVTVMKTLRRLP
jgi:cell division transport system permease protein